MRYPRHFYPRHLLDWLSLAFVAIALAGVALISRHLTVPPQPNGTNSDQNSTQAQNTGAGPYEAELLPTATETSADEYARLRALASVDLRRPLYDPPPPPKPPAPEPPPLRLTLLGTILEGETQQAILQTSDGRTVFLNLGESLNEATLTEVQADRVAMDYFGRHHELMRERGRP